MQLKKLVLVTLLGFVCLNQASYANIRVSSSFLPAKPGDDVCSQFAGNWSGDGRISALGGLVQCHYTGGSQGGIAVSKNSDGTYQVGVNIAVASGSSSICPATVVKTLSATCVNGAINVNTTPDVQLTGSMTSPTAASLSGTIEITAGINANVDSLTLAKQ